MSKLAALLNMLASEFDGERANAARMIAKLAAAEKKTVADFVMSPQVIYRDRIVEKTVYKEREPKFDDDDLRRYRPHPGSRAKRPSSDDEGLIEGLKWARNYEHHLSEFEIEFMASVLATCWFDSDLSYKQERVAKRIIAKVNAYEGEPLV